MSAHSTPATTPTMPPGWDGERLLDVFQVLAVVGFRCRETLRKLERTGDLVPVRHGRSVRYRSSDVAAFVARGASKSGGGVAMRKDGFRNRNWNRAPDGRACIKCKWFLPRHAGDPNTIGTCQRGTSNWKQRNPHEWCDRFELDPTLPPGALKIEKTYGELQDDWQRRNEEVERRRAQLEAEYEASRLKG